MEKLKGNIHSFETFGAVDGPGTRFIVFMQGCNLKCKYCHNRDTWSLDKNTQYSSDEIIRKILRYKEYYGNVPKLTISGGEPFVQKEFLLDFVEKAKQKEIEVAIDTNGMLKIDETIEKIVDKTDIFLVDLKHIDSEKCEKLVGSKNKLELEFIDYLISKNKRIWLRQVIIPNINTDEKDLKKLKDFLAVRKNNIEKIELLPYHDYGRYKWEELGYTPQAFGIPDNSTIEKIKDYLDIK